MINNRSTSFTAISYLKASQLLPAQEQLPIKLPTAALLLPLS